MLTVKVDATIQADPAAVWKAIMEAIGAVSWNETAKDVAKTVKRHP